MWYRTRLIEYYFSFFNKDVNKLDEIGANFKEARLNSSVSLEEASEDTEIPVFALEQIEAGAIGSFKDIFKLKGYLNIYAKYLGLNGSEIIDKFNEYLFEYTSKIPVEDLEKAVSQKNNEDVPLPPQGVQAVSPYLTPHEEHKNTKIVITIILIVILMAITVIWAIKQVM